MMRARVAQRYQTLLEGRDARLAAQRQRFEALLAQKREKVFEQKRTYDRLVGDLKARAVSDGVHIMRLQAELEKAARFRYGSYTSGIAGWEGRWDASPGRRVLLFAPKDYAGSFGKWAVALNRHTDYAARLAVLQPHQYGYANDLVLPFPDVFEAPGLRHLIDEADVIHIKDESGFFTGANRLPPGLFTRTGKPLVYTAYGGFMRQLCGDRAFRAHVASFDARVAMTPDLVYDWFDGQFIPHAIDTLTYRHCWRDGRKIGHSPSTKARKATGDLLSAVESSTLEIDVIHGVSHEACMERKKHVNLFFDQAGAELPDRLGVDTVVGWYGNSAIEAAVFGIPTIAHLSQTAFEGARRAGCDIEARCAILNTPRGPDGIRATIETYFAMSAAEREHLSWRTRRWMEEFHSFETCASALAGVYDGLLARRSRRDARPAGHVAGAARG